MYYATSIMMLGYTRINGVQAYNSATREFNELTPALAKKLISQGDLVGILWKNNEEGGEFICDVENWNQQNIPVRTACGKFRPLLNDVPGQPVNTMYTLVRVLDTDYRGRLFEVVSNTCARIKLTESQLRGLNEIQPIAGVWISDLEIKWNAQVAYEDRRTVIDEITEEGDEIIVDCDDEASSLDELFGASTDGQDAFMQETVPEEIEQETKVTKTEVKKSATKRSTKGKGKR